MAASVTESTSSQLQEVVAGPGRGLVAPKVERRRTRRSRRLRGAGVLVSVVLLAAYFSLAYPHSFATSENLLNMSRVGAILLVVALGQTFALVVGGFDLSVAANMSFSGTVAALVATHGHGVISAVVVGIACGAAIGFLNGILIARLRVTPFVTTLGMLTFLGGLGNQISSGQSIYGLPASFGAFGRDDWGPIPSAVGVAVVVLFAAWLILSRTRTGLYIFAVGGSREAARVSGVLVARYEVLAYSLCGLFAGIAGVMLSSRINVGQASLAQGYELQSIAIAVIGGVAIGGGVARLSGVVSGVCLLVVLTTGLDIAGLNSFYQEMVTGLVLVTAVLIAQMRGVVTRVALPTSWLRLIARPRS